MEYVLGLVAFIGLAYNFYNTRQREVVLTELKSSREGEDAPQFINQFLNLGYKEELVLETYQQLRKVIKDPDLLLDKEDHFESNYLLDKQQVKDLMTDTCLELNLKLPKNKDVFEFERRNGTIVTFEKVLQFISSNCY